MSMSGTRTSPAPPAQSPGPDATEELLRLDGISKQYGHNTVLSDVSFTVRRGEVVGLLGDNGAGKSTLVKIMSGVVQPTGGRYFWEGREVTTLTRQETERNGVETIFQDSALVDGMTITRNIFMGREVTNRFGIMKMAEMDAITARILDSVVTIEGIKSPKQLVGSLSGGQQQAVAIARAVHFKRSLLILDEPTSALAVRATEALLAYLRQLKDEGVSSVLVTHNLHHAYEVCDRHVVMNHGQKILDVRREDTSVEELTAAVVEGRLGIERHRLAQQGA
jgi:simple sugar transport system ATP-binding protein